jgi:hypothetical protein
VLQQGEIDEKARAGLTMSALAVARVRELSVESLEFFGHSHSPMRSQEGMGRV